MKNREKFTFDVENFAKNLLYKKYELKISIRNYKKKTNHKYETRIE